LVGVRRFVTITMSAAREAQREAERAVRAEVRRLNELQARMLRECHAKCIAKPRDGDLAIAEMACLDRCVPKYLETHDLVGKEIDTVRRAFAGPTRQAAEKEREREREHDAAGAAAARLGGGGAR
jgi:hypothetical protein